MRTCGDRCCLPACLLPRSLVKLIALDGSTFNMRAMMEGVALGMPGPGSLVFGGVGQEEALPSRPAALAAAAAAAAGPLDLRLRHAMVRWRGVAAMRQCGCLLWCGAVSQLPGGALNGRGWERLLMKILPDYVFHAPLLNTLAPAILINCGKSNTVYALVQTKYKQFVLLQALEMLAMW